MSSDESSSDESDSSLDSYGDRGPMEFIQISPSLASAPASAVDSSARPSGQIGIMPLVGRSSEDISEHADEGDLLVDFPSRRIKPAATATAIPAFAKKLLPVKRNEQKQEHQPSTPPQRHQQPPKPFKAPGKPRTTPPPSNTVHVRCRGGSGSNRELNNNDETTPTESDKQQSTSSSFHPLLLVASIENAHSGPIFAMRFSPNGKYLATGGADGKILVWQVAPPQHSTYGSNGSTQPAKQPPSPPGNIITRQNGSAPMGTEIKLLSAEPVAIFDEHRAEVVDLSWSNQSPDDAANDPFLLSASLDKTVRLWHISRPGPLHIFQHADMVTCVDFHPTNDSYFVSGGFDMKLRCWSIPNGRVKAWTQTPDIITAAQFSPNGNMVVAGLMKGQVYFYMTEGMKYYTQLESKNRRGRASDGRKVTGLAFRVIGGPNARQQHRRWNSVGQVTQSLAAVDLVNTAVANEPTRGRTYSEQSATTSVSGSSASRRVQEQLLVTTNDSRLRLYEVDGFCAIQKYKGALNTKMQIKASFSESGMYIICGSESGVVHIWENLPNQMSLKAKATAHKKVDRSNTCASFDPYAGTTNAGQRVVTEALFVPPSCVKRSFLMSQLFPSLNSLDHVRYDFGSAMVVTSDDEGTIKIFMKRSSLDTVIRAAGPEGPVHKNDA